MHENFEHASRFFKTDTATTSTPPNSFLSLSIDIWQECILTELYTHELLNFAKVSKMCYFLAHTTLHKDIHEIECDEHENFSFMSPILKNWGNLKLVLLRRGGAEVSDLTPLQGIHSLRINNCAGITNVEPLKNAHTLILHNLCNLPDFTPLGNVHYLELRVANIASTVGLGNLHTLHVNNCPNITDLSPLSSLNTLIIDNCSGIVDLSPVSKIETLVIKNCPQIRNIECLSKISNLTVYKCPVQNFSCLTNVKRLEIHACPVKMITDLDNLQELHLSWCSQLSIFSLSPKTKIISVISCGGISSLEAFTHAEKLTLSRLKVTDLKPLKKVIDLSISWIDVGDLSPLESVQILHIERCNEAFEVLLSSLRKLRNLFVYSCRVEKTSFNHLDLLESLYIKGCYSLLDLPKFSKLKFLHISDCPQLTNFGKLSYIPRVVITP